MYRWDKAVITYYEVIILGAFILAMFAGIAVFLFGRWFWWAARPVSRILITRLALLIVFEVSILLTNFFVSVGWMSGVDPQYAEFVDKGNFKPDGLFDGLINPGVAALAFTQVITVMGLVLLSVLGGTCISLLVQAGRTLRSPRITILFRSATPTQSPLRLTPTNWMRTGEQRYE